MGKSRKLGGRKAHRAPYEKPNVPELAMADDGAGADMDLDMDAALEDPSVFERGAPVRDKTRGAVKQRHKKEYRVLREKLAEMKRSRLKLHKAKPDELAERKDITKKMKAIVDAFQKRCKRELDQFDAAHGEQQGNNEQDDDDEKEAGGEADADMDD